jgi:hypothetical protein
MAARSEALLGAEPDGESTGYCRSSGGMARWILQNQRIGRDIQRRAEQRIIRNVSGRPARHIR